MDVLLLLAQVVLVVLLVVLPLFSAFDKWQSWSRQRKLLALALGVGIAVVAFSQYQRIVHFHEGNLERALGNVGLSHGPWYARRVFLSSWEYLGSVVAGSVLASLALASARRREWAVAVSYSALFALMLTLMMLIKFGRWD